MSSPSRPASLSPPAPRGQFFRAAVVGAASLQGKEVAEVLNERNFPTLDVRLLDDDEQAQGKLEAMGEEVSFIQKVRAEQFQNVDFAFFAGGAAATRKSWKAAQKAGSTVIDLSGALESEPDTSLRSVWIERETDSVPAPDLQPRPCVVPHPVSVMLALILIRIKKQMTPGLIAGTLHLPASETGQRGMDELHHQTVNLLSFQALPKEVYDAQVAFNLLPRYGTNAQISVAATLERIMRELNTLAGPKLPAVALNALQAPVFHGVALSLYVELPGAEAGVVEKALSGDHVSVVGEGDPPSNVSAAGQADIQVSVRKDATTGNGFWIWAVGDNLRIAAINAVECAESLTATRPVGKIQ